MLINDETLNKTKSPYFNNLLRTKPIFNRLLHGRAFKHDAKGQDDRSRRTWVIFNQTNRQTKLKMSVKTKTNAWQHILLLDIVCVVVVKLKYKSRIHNFEIIINSEWIRNVLVSNVNIWWFPRTHAQYPFLNVLLTRFKTSLNLVFHPKLLLK